MVRFVGVRLGAALGDAFRRFRGGWDWLGMVRSVPGAAEPDRGRSEAVRASPIHLENSKIIDQSRPKTDPYKTDYRTILTGRGNVESISQAGATGPCLGGRRCGPRS